MFLGSFFSFDFERMTEAEAARPMQVSVRSESGPLQETPDRNRDRFGLTLRSFPLLNGVSASLTRKERDHQTPWAVSEDPDDAERESP